MFARPRHLASLLLLATLGCEARTGTGSVRAHFTTNECRSGTQRDDLRDFSFDAEYLATERFVGIFGIIIQRSHVDIEETDAAQVRLSLDRLLDANVIHIDRDQIVRTDLSIPIQIPTSTRPDQANLALSLFETCPEYPTHFAESGLLTITKLTLATEPNDTGAGEIIAGTLTATLTRANAKGPVGTVDIAFDFDPPRRPLTDFE